MPEFIACRILSKMTEYKGALPLSLLISPSRSSQLRVMFLNQPIVRFLKITGTISPGAVAVDLSTCEYNSIGWY